MSELRRGQPIVLHNETYYLLFAAAELLEKELFDHCKLISGNAYVTLTASKVEYMSKNEEHTGKRLPVHNFEQLLHLVNCSWTEKETADDHLKELQSSKPLDETAVALLKYAELLPYALLVDIGFENKYEMRKWCRENDLLALDWSHVAKFQQQSHSVYEVCRASLFLRQTQDVNIVSYRTYNGGREHHAIIIGQPDEHSEPLVRVHSSCYTGDLLDSLSCDCKSQLHEAVRVMAETGNGIILYLMQEGRGIGLINKLRTYNLQRKRSLDTVDANRILGFKDDERSFVVAAEILKRLNIRRISLLTNNDRKLVGLENMGISITKRVPLIVERNKYNDSYLETKINKLGHRLRAC